MDQKTIQLDLRFDEVNLLLKALGNYPSNEVYALIAKVQQQATQQIPPPSKATKSKDVPHQKNIQLDLKFDEINHLLKA